MFYLHSAMSDTSDTASTASLVSTSGTCWFGYTEEPLDLCDLLAQEDTRLLADINDYDDPLWILDCIEYDNDWNEWMVAYFCQLTENGLFIGPYGGGDTTQTGIMNGRTTYSKTCVCKQLARLSPPLKCGNNRVQRGNCRMKCGSNRVHRGKD